MLLVPRFRRSVLVAVAFVCLCGVAFGQTESKSDRNGPKTYPISSIFLDGAGPTATPSPRPMTPPVVDGTPLPGGYSDSILPPPTGLVPSGGAAALRPEPTATPVPPTPTPAPTATATPLQPASAKNPLDLNAASLDELVLLPGVSPHRAELILAHRRAISGFRNVDQLQEVFGISEELFLKLRPLVRVGPLPPGGIRPIATPFARRALGPALPLERPSPALPTPLTVPLPDRPVAPMPPAPVPPAAP